MKKTIAAMALSLAAVAAVADATTSLTATRSTDGNGYAVLAWDGDETDVYRAYSAENPNWMLAGSVGAGVQTFTDSSGYYGIKTYYKVGGQVVSFTRMRRLERSELNEGGGFLSGVSLICSYGDGSTAFDGNISTRPDIYGYGDPMLGVDFGAGKVYVAGVRVYPRTDWDGGPGRLTGVVVRGNNHDGDPWNNYSVISCNPVPAERDMNDWYMISCDPETAWRYVYLWGSGWCGNVAEIQVFGWYESDITGLTDPVTDFSVAAAGNRQIAVSWNCTGTPDEFIVERQVDGGAWAVLQPVITQNGSSYSFADSAVDYYSTYAYRVTARYEAFDVSSVSSVASAKCVEPMNLALSYSDLSRNYYAVLNWENCTTIDGKSVAVYRSARPDVWTKIAVVAAGTLTYTDTQARTYGVCYRYRIAPEESGALKPSNIVDYYRVRRLDVRDGNGALSSPASYFCSYNGYCYQAFNGNLYDYDGASWDWGAPILGVNFGTGANDVHVCFVRFYQLSGHEATLDNVSAYGSTAAQNPWEHGTRIGGMNAADHPAGEGWRYVYTDDSVGYMSAYVTGSDCRFGEMEFYGYTDEDMKGGFMLIIR